MKKNKILFEKININDKFDDQIETIEDEKNKN